MSQATYDGAYAPVPWRAVTQNQGEVKTWIEDALGGVVIPSCTRADAMLITGAVNSHNALVTALETALGLLEMEARNEPVPMRKLGVDLLVEQIKASLTLARPVEPTELPSLWREPDPEVKPVDAEAVAAKAHELMRADGWDPDLGWHRTAPDVQPGPMSRERWAEFTKAAQKELYP